MLLLLLLLLYRCGYHDGDDDDDNDGDDDNGLFGQYIISEEESGSELRRNYIGAPGYVLLLRRCGLSCSSPLLRQKTGEETRVEKEPQLCRSCQSPGSTAGAEAPCVAVHGP